MVLASKSSKDQTPTGSLGIRLFASAPYFNWSLVGIPWGLVVAQIKQNLKLLRDFATSGKQERNSLQDGNLRPPSAKGLRQVAVNMQVSENTKQSCG